MTSPITALFAPEALFSLGSTLAMAGWVALAASPAGARWAPMARRVAGLGLPLLLALAYAVLILRHGLGDGGYGSLAEVQRLFEHPGVATAGWLHYLAFDLFVGAWIHERWQAARLPHTVLLVLLALTFLFGPAGLLAWAVLQPLAVRLRRAGPVAA